MNKLDFTQEDWRRILNALKMASDEHEKAAKAAFHRARDRDYDFHQAAAEAEKFHDAECEKYKLLQIQVWRFAHD